MNLNKAIEIAEHLSTAGAPKITLDEIISIKLGIEALKRCELASKETKWGDWIPLPGETQE